MSGKARERNEFRGAHGECAGDLPDEYSFGECIMVQSDQSKPSGDFSLAVLQKGRIQSAPSHSKESLVDTCSSSGSSMPACAGVTAAS
jgi:hypothetical protein